jgi:hypothetical protein
MVQQSHEWSCNTYCTCQAGLATSEGIFKSCHEMPWIFLDAIFTFRKSSSQGGKASLQYQCLAVTIVTVRQPRALQGERKWEVGMTHVGVQLCTGFHRYAQGLHRNAES